MRLYETTAWGVLFAVSFGLTACEDKQQVALETFKFTRSDTPVDTLNIDEIQSVVVVPTPKSITDKVIWTSADPEIAQVQSNEQGLVAGVMGINVGKTVISATTADGRFSKSFPVNVIVKVNKIIFSDEMIMESPDKGGYTVLFDPVNATIQDLMWSSSRQEIVGIDPLSGLMTAISPGSSLITATTRQGNKSATIEVFVSGEPPVFGKDYCSIVAENRKGGDYCADQVFTSGAIRDLAHSDKSLPPPPYYYKFFKDERLIVRKGEPFTLNLIQSNTWSRSLVWIDWKGNKDFANEGELVAAFGKFYGETETGSNPDTYSKLITVPEDATSGITRMRVITGDAWTLDFDVENLEPCGTTPYGTIKDFEVEIRD